MLILFGMAKYKITYNREACIGAAACVAVAEKFWQLAGDGKADLLNGNGKGVKEIKPGVFEIIIDEEHFEMNKEAEEVCPVNVIKVEKIG